MICLLLQKCHNFGRKRHDILIPYKFAIITPSAFETIVEPNIFVGNLQKGMWILKSSDENCQKFWRPDKVWTKLSFRFIFLTASHSISASLKYPMFLASLKLAFPIIAVAGKFNFTLEAGFPLLHSVSYGSCIIYFAQLQHFRRCKIIMQPIAG